MLGLLLACTGTSTGDSAAPEGCAASGETHTWVWTTLTLARETDGVSVGFDLDGRVSDEEDTETCGVADFVHPDGTTGIDNAFAPLVPFMEESEAGALEPALQNEINSGGLLVLIELAGLDDPGHDDCVDLRFGQADGEPLVGPDDRLLPGQTFDWHPDHASADFAGLSLVDGQLDTPPFSLDIPFPVFDADLRMAMGEARLRVALGDDGDLAGSFGGRVPVTFMLDAADQDQIDPDVLAFFEAMLFGASDLAPDADGTCQEISMTFEQTGVPAWTFLE